MELVIFEYGGRAGGRGEEKCLINNWDIVDVKILHQNTSSPLQWTRIHETRWRLNEWNKIFSPPPSYSSLVFFPTTIHFSSPFSRRNCVNTPPQAIKSKLKKNWMKKKKRKNWKIFTYPLENLTGSIQEGEREAERGRRETDREGKTKICLSES